MFLSDEDIPRGLDALISLLSERELDGSRLVDFLVDCRGFDDRRASSEMFLALPDVSTARGLDERSLEESVGRISAPFGREGNGSEGT